MLMRICDIQTSRGHKKTGILKCLVYKTVVLFS